MEHVLFEPAVVFKHLTNQRTKKKYVGARTQRYPDVCTG